MVSEHVVKLRLVPIRGRGRPTKWISRHAHIQVRQAQVMVHRTGSVWHVYFGDPKIGMECVPLRHGTRIDLAQIPYRVELSEPSTVIPDA